MYNKKRTIGISIFLLIIVGLSILVPTEKDFHHSYIDGYEDGTFKATKELNRAEAAALATKALKLEKVSNNLNFKDVKKSDWFYKYVNSAYEVKLIKGYPNKTFKPKQKITRAEAITMLVRYQNPNLDNIVISNPEYKNHWAAKEIQYAVNNGIIEGYGDGTFRPNDTIKRIEFVIIINNLLDRKCDIKDIDISKTFKDVSSKNWFYQSLVEATNDHYKGDSVEQPSKPEDKPGKPNEKPTKPEDKPSKPEEKPTVKPGRPGSKPLPKGFTPEAIKQTNIDQWINSLEFREAKPETFDQVLTYFREQTDVEVLDYNIQQEYTKYDKMYLQMGMGPSIGGNASFLMGYDLGDKEKGTTITRYVENGPEWNITGKPFVSQRMYQKGSFIEDLYDLYYNSITWNELDYYMTPEDTIKSYIKIDFNNGDFIEYRISQDVENKTFPKELFNGLEKQWNHKTRPIRK